MEYFQGSLYVETECHAVQNCEQFAFWKIMHNTRRSVKNATRRDARISQVLKLQCVVGQATAESTCIWVLRYVGMWRRVLRLTGQARRSVVLVDTNYFHINRCDRQPERSGRISRATQTRAVQFCKWMDIIIIIIMIIIKHNMKELQTTAILGTAQIIREVLMWNYETSKWESDVWLTVYHNSVWIRKTN